jgi:hypothetical protein
MRNSLLLVSIFIFFTCNQENSLSDSQLKHAGNKLSNSDDRNELKGGILPLEDEYDCEDNDGTCETDCPSFSCTREDLDPCDYDDMGEYGQAVACMLNKHVNGLCGTTPGLPLGCNDITYCFKNLITPGDLVDYLNIGLINCWRYCSLASCEEWLCPSLLGDITHHLYLDVDAQNILIDYAWDLAEREAPECNESLPAVPYKLKFLFCYDITTSPPGPTNCWEGSSSFCTNMSIKLQVSYKCCE